MLFEQYRLELSLCYPIIERIFPLLRSGRISFRTCYLEFCDRTQALTNQSYRLTMQTRIHQLTADSDRA